jgi:hypothetical protein
VAGGLADFFPLFRIAKLDKFRAFIMQVPV